jgi:hypothetical protein
LGWGLSVESPSDLYDKIKEDVEFRREWTKKCDVGFKSLSIIPNVPNLEEKAEAKKAAYVFWIVQEEVVWRGFEPPAPWSRTK